MRWYVQPYRTTREERAVLRYETRSGERAQVDWGSFGYINEEGRQQRLYAFAMQLSYSRMLNVEYTTRMDVMTWQRCHQHAFAYFGGVPEVVLHDNLKTAVLSRGTGGKIQWNPRYLDFALFYGFTPQPCRPYRPQAKGKIERSLVPAHYADLPRSAPPPLPALARQQAAGMWAAAPQVETRPLSVYAHLEGLHD